MIVDFSTILTDLNGAPIMDVDRDADGKAVAGSERPITLRTIAENVLTGTIADEEKLSGKKKLEQFLLAVKVHDGKEVDVREAAAILDLIEKAYPPLIVGRCTELLNPSK